MSILDADDVAAMTVQAVAEGGADPLMRWLARRLEAGAGLIRPDGTVRTWHTASGPGRAVLTEDIVPAADGPEVATVDGAGWRAHVADTGAGGCSLVVVTANDQRVADRDLALIRHAARLAGLCLADEALRRLRETVLRLLLRGHADAARAVADTAGPPLPDTVCVGIIEARPSERDRTATVLERSRGAWAIRCPVYARHNIVLLAAGRQGTADVLGTLLAACPDAVIGTSGPVPLRDVADGYTAAMDALAVARRATGRLARSAGGGLADVLGPDARRWAARELGPLLDYRSPRPHDPGGRELCETLTAWLDFGGTGAARLLHLHRNTLSARVNAAGGLLGADLADPVQRAALRLAARILAKPETASDGPVPELGELLAQPAAQRWADMLLKPLLADPDPCLLPAVRAWLAAGRQATPEAARSSGVSPSGMRRRISRAERLLRRTLTNGPGPYDLHLALIAAGHLPQPLTTVPHGRGVAVQLSRNFP